MFIDFIVPQDIVKISYKLRQSKGTEVSATDAEGNPIAIFNAARTVSKYIYYYKD